MSKGTSSISYTYDMAGMRSSKTVDGVVHNYVTQNGKVVRETFGSTVLNFIYDADGRPFAMEYSLDGGTTVSVYYYVLNLQGDVMRLITASGDIRADYSYGPYGETKVLDINGNEVTNPNSIGMLNPLRYRGYYCDNETGFYYVSSRYYDPEIGRFINADDVDLLGANGDFVGLNLFAYCGNNPVNRVDYTGQFWSEIWEFAKTAVAEIGKAMEVMSPAYAGCGGAAAVDGPLPFGDVVAVAGAALLTVGAIGYGIHQAAQAPAISSSKAEEKAEAIPAFPPTPTVIYRYYSSKTENLSPRPGIDYDGLSFSTKPPRPGVSAVVTTIEQVNATGILTAIPTGGTHVTVIPTNGTVNQWMSQGQSSIWSQTLSLIVVEWDGGF